MHDLSLLQDLVIIVAAALAVVVVLERVGVPAVAGMIIAGTLIGPVGLGLIDDVHRVDLLAEVGIVLLLFGIGLELSLERMRMLWRLVIFGGTLQVSLTILAVFALAMALGVATNTALLLGFMIAVSSTAIVLRALQARTELDAPHGLLIVGVLVFQDLCVVPMILVLPLLAGESGSGPDVLLLLVKALAVLVGVLLAAWLAVPRVLHLVARTRQRNLFVMTVFVICMGTAWLVNLAGISLALGAFLAGLVVSGSDYRTQALSDLLPMREVLTSVFFVSIGMLLDPLEIWARALPVLTLLSGILAGKFVVMFFIAALMGLPTRAAVLSAAGLAQVGEFSFVLMRAAEPVGLLPEPLGGDLLSATILSMLVTPLFLAISPHLAAGVGHLGSLTKVMRVRSVEDFSVQTHHMRDHVVIAGLGVTGEELALSLGQSGIPYIAVDLNPDRVRRAVVRNVRAVFGDITSNEVMEHLELARAKEFVVAINDPVAGLAAVRNARRIMPGLHIVVRTRFLNDAPGYRAAGADVVIPAELEAAVRILDYVLGRYAVTAGTVGQRVASLRERYEMEKVRQVVEGNGEPPVEPPA